MIDSQRTRSQTHDQPLLERQELVNEILSLLERPGLITLLGAPGIGKTHLARAVRAQLKSLSAWVDLSVIDQPNALGSLLLQAFKLLDQGASTALERALEYLKSREIILVLDNLEHLDLEASLNTIMTTCPDLRILCTSRAPSRCKVERLFRVPTLSLPAKDDLQSLKQSEAVQLYMQRATHINPRFRLNQQNAPAVAELSRTAEGLPLALELLATAAGLYSPETQLERYRRDPTRSLGGTEGVLMRAVVWSLERLSPDEQVLFARLSVCLGGWDALTAAALFEGTQQAAWQALEHLVQHQLVAVHENQPDRYYFLEPIRAIAVQRLQNMGQQNAQEAHASHFLKFIEEAQDRLQGPEAAVLKKQFSLDRWNFDAALRFWQNHWNERARLVLALRPLALGWGRIRAHRTVMNELIASASIDQAELPALYLWRARSGKIVGEAKEVENDLRTALRLVKRAASSSTGREAYALLASVAHYQGKSNWARRVLERILGWRRLYGTASELARHLVAHGQDLYIMGDWDAASKLLTEARDQSSSLLSHDTQITLNTCLAAIALNQDQFDVAETLYTHTRQLAIELDDPMNFAIVDHALGHLAQQRGDLEGAITHWCHALQTFYSLDHLEGTLVCLDHLVLELVQTNPSTAIYALGCIEYQRQHRQEPRQAGSEQMMQEMRLAAQERLGIDTVKQLEAKGAVERLVVVVNKFLEAALWETGRSKQLLTHREFEVLELLAQGSTDKLVARRLGITERTARFHSNAIMQKLEVRTRSQAVNRAWTLGILKPHEAQG
jgi:predicted ATPase/DNA-binding CsgD family transcriptional regulator